MLSLDVDYVDLRRLQEAHVEHMGLSWTLLNKCYVSLCRSDLCRDDCAPDLHVEPML